MKYIIMIMTTIYMAACSTGSGGNSEGSSGPSPLSITAPMPTPTNDNLPPPTITPPTQPTCAPLQGTKWVAYNQPTLTPASSDQLGRGYYVATFDLTALSDMFAESQYVGAPFGYLTCTRSYQDGIPSSAGNPNSLVWHNTDGFCGNMISWFQFDATQCNQLTVTLRDQNGNVYLTQDYKPAN